MHFVLWRFSTRSAAAAAAAPSTQSGDKPGVTFIVENGVGKQKEMRRLISILQRGRKRAAAKQPKFKMHSGRVGFIFPDGLQPYKPVTVLAELLSSRGWALVRTASGWRYLFCGECWTMYYDLRGLEGGYW